MSKIHKSIILIILIFSVLLTYDSVYAIDLSPSDDLGINLKGRLNYAAKWRMEDREKVDPTLSQQASGNTNFDKYDMINNKGSINLELAATYGYFSLFASGNAFYDSVYADEDFYDKMGDGSGGIGISDERRDEIRKHAAYRAEMLEYYFQTLIDTFTCRIGSQIVQWGDSISPIWAPGINVVNAFNFDKATSVGFTAREMQEPAKMIWASFGVCDWLTVEGVYKPDFDPRKNWSVVGTWYSLTDSLGYGSNHAIPEERPDNFNEAVKEGHGFKDIQQYGGAIKTTWPVLSNLDVGFYYFHYLNNDVPLPVVKKATFVYPEIDMYGMTVSQAIEAFNLNLQITGELAYRPNDAEATIIPAAPQYGPLGDYVEVPTLTWNISVLRVFDDFLFLSYITPWRFSTSFIGEVFGKRIMNYDEKKNFYCPENTYYYTLPLTFGTNDMIDNTTVNLICSLSGMLYKRDRSYQQGGLGIGAKYGDSWEAKVIYNYKLGKPESDPFTDRDDLSAELSWYF